MKRLAAVAQHRDARDTARRAKVTSDATRHPHTPDHWPLALSLWVACQQQLAQLKAENEALLKAWDAEDAERRQ